MLGFCLTWACTGVGHAHMCNLPFWVWRTVFPCSHTWLFTIFHNRLLQWPLSSGRKECETAMWVGMRISLSLIHCSMTNCDSPCSSPTTAKRSFPGEVLRDTLMYMHIDEPWRASLIPCKFSIKLILVLLVIPDGRIPIIWGKVWWSRKLTVHFIRS